ncbi:MAG TPA: hypothetical protein VKU19_40370 [Bryobacteraceae bacterium]|nr:hypothetical protein [Bryobacteraceae bacterium]
MACTMLTVLSLCCVLSAQPLCSIDSVRGTWAFAELGWTVPIASGSSAVASPVTVIGAFSVDYSGKMTGSGTTISGAGIPGTPIPAGEVLDFDFTGTVEITSDCTGVLRYAIQIKGTPGPLPGQFIERFVYSPHTDELLSMSIQSPLSKPLWIGRYTRLGRVQAAVAWPTVSH